jgi:hypothetical protein
MTKIAVEQIGNAECRLDAESPDFRRAVRTTKIGDHPAAADREIGRHGTAHATQPDKTDASTNCPALMMPAVDREVHVIVNGQYATLQ